MRASHDDSPHVRQLVLAKDSHMTQIAASAGAAGEARFADAFGPVTLATFAQNPSGAHLFRVQHEMLVQLMARVVSSTEVDVGPESALRARTALTTLTTLLPVHQSLEDSLVHRALVGEPRARMLAEQFEREMVPLGAEVAALSRRYPAASSILVAPRGEFAAAASGLFSRLQERFRREERDLFPSFDRAASGATAFACAS
jgi:hypothetical protein